jgi:AAA15 family ATPase/GTPase
MVVEFSFANVFSFKDKQKVSFQPEPLKELVEHLHIPYLYNPKEQILKSLAVYGHNSHGKSNFLKAYEFFLSFINTSFNQPKRFIPIEQFVLNTSMQNKPSFFEIIFFIADTKYRYGFEVTTNKIVAEWLFYAPFGKKENYLFNRFEQDFQLSKVWNKEANNKIELQSVPFAKPNVLLLSVLIAQDVVKIKEISEKLNASIIVRDLNNTNNLLAMATEIFSQDKYQADILAFIEDADLGFTTIFDKIEKKLQEQNEFDRGFLNMLYTNEIKRFELYTKHDIYNEKLFKQTSIEFEMIKNESDGSIKFFIVACLLVYAIKNQLFIWIDELDSRFHSDLLELLVKAYHNPKKNSIGSQMVFTTHNTILLNKRLRRDQVVTVEKNEYGESNIKRLHTKETPVRIDTSIEKEYRKGKLGGVSKKIKAQNNQSLLFE